MLQRIDVFFCGADMSAEANYALLADGNIWRRGYGTFANAIVWLVAYGSPIAAVLGLMLQPLLVRVSKFKPAAQHGL